MEKLILNNLCAIAKGLYNIEKNFPIPAKVWERENFYCFQDICSLFTGIL